MDKLRDYQQKAVDEVRKAYLLSIKKVLLHMPTGSGKTLCFAYMASKVLLKPEKTVVLIVRGKTLVDQASRRFEQYGIDHGVIMSGHWRTKPGNRVQVCSIDTLYSILKRGGEMPPADLVITDECHLAVSKSFIEVYKSYENSYFISATATPHVKKGLRHLADMVIRPTDFRKLVAAGSLVPPRCFCPTKIDLSGCKIRNGDYVDSDLEEAVEKSAIFGDILDQYKKRLDGKAAIVFAVSVKHSHRIRDSFEAIGIKACHVDANTPGHERLRIIAAMESGEIKIIVNVGVFCTGLDIPCLGGVILARPTMSYNLYVQQVGRGTRPYPGKVDFIVNDHVGNVKMHGLIQDEPECDLDGSKPRENESKPCICEDCYAVFCPRQRYSDYIALEENLRGHVPEHLKKRASRTKMLYLCPLCDHDNTPIGEPIIRNEGDEDDDLHELTEDEIKILGIKSAYKNIEILRSKTKKSDGKTYHRNWSIHKLLKEYSQDQLKSAIPKEMRGFYCQPETQHTRH